MSTNDLGKAEQMGAEAIGQPGQRRFRMFVRTRTSSALLWMEKEQLLNLSLIIDRILAQISEGRILRTEARAGGLAPISGDLPANFPDPAAFDLQVGQLRLGFDSETEIFTLAAVPFDIEEDESGEPQLDLHTDEALTFLFNLEQAQQLTTRIAFLVSSGRPLCPFCQTPLDGRPHACVKQNGHREIIQISTEESEDEEE